MPFVMMLSRQGVLKAVLKGERSGLGDVSPSLWLSSPNPPRDDIVSDGMIAELPACCGI